MGRYGECDIDDREDRLMRQTITLYSLVTDNILGSYYYRSCDDRTNDRRTYITKPHTDDMFKRHPDIFYMLTQAGYAEEGTEVTDSEGHNWKFSVGTWRLCPVDTNEISIPQRQLDLFLETTEA